MAVVGSNEGSKSVYWTCSVDGVDAGNDVETLAPICKSPCNNYLLCHATDLEDGNHTLTVNATPASNQTFWLDRIEYVPSQQVSLEQKAIRVTPWDSALVGSKGKTFTFYGKLQVYSITKLSLGTTVGTSVSWYGTIFSAFDGSAFNLSWTMDQMESNYTWDWRGNLNASNPLMNQRFFETPTYPYGKHTLTVTDPVGLDYVIVQNGTVPTSSTTTGLTVATSGVGGMSRAVGSGAIAGGVIGGVLAFGLAIFVFIFCCRRLRSQKETKIYQWDALFFRQKAAGLSLSPRPYLGQPKSRTLANYSQNSLLPSHSSHTCGSTSTNESSVTNGSTHHTGTGTHGQPQPMPSSAQPDVAVGVGQDNNQPVPHLRVTTRPNSGVHSNDQALATVIHLPPEYTPN